MQEWIYKVRTNMPHTTDTEQWDNIADGLEIESYILFGSYFILSIICWFLFYHHPNNIGIKIQKS